MAQLNLGVQYKSGENASVGVSGHEPNGEFWTYRINAAETIDNSMALPDPSVFHPFASPDKIKAPAITITPVDNMGVKKFIGWGAGAYYHPIDSEYSYLTLPIHYKLNEKEPPDVVIANDKNTVIFDIEQGSVNYETVRLVVSQGNLREEKVLYFKKNEPLHYEMVTAFTGIVSASVRAHADEINIVSKLVEADLDLGDTLEAILAINQKSGPMFNYDADIIQFSDDRGMSIENIKIVKEADGGYVTGGVSYEQEVFTSSGTFTVPEGVDKVAVLVVAGGGGGGSRQGGGGGAGGLVLEENYPVVPSSNVTITVGDGGIGGANGGRGANGQNSTFDLLEAIGGGGGGGRTTNNAGANGGSGGGASGLNNAGNVSGGTGIAGQGMDGGTSLNNNGAGGGGAGEQGFNGTNVQNTGDAGDGGAGLDLSALFGADVGVNGWFAGGGGGGAWQGTAGLGGQGGGGNGAKGDPSSGNPQSGQANTGGGGGGSGETGRAGGAGGSGIVIVRYVGDSASTARINSIPIPDRSAYGDDYVVSVDEV